MKEKLKEFFAAFCRYPGASLHLCIGKYTGWTWHFDRNGFVINLAFFRIIVAYYDFIASAAVVMAENNQLRRDNAMMHKMYSGRTMRRVK